MLTYQDCVGLCSLTEEEITSVAKHEHLPSIAALEMGDFILHQPNGAAWLRRMLEDDISQAAARHDFREAAHLMAVLRRFVGRTGSADRAMM